MLLNLYVSNLQLKTSDEKVLEGRRQPKLNGFNNKNYVLRLISGEEFRVDVKIPTIVNQYNHWMLGVDVCNQLIA